MSNQDDTKTTEQSVQDDTAPTLDSKDLLDFTGEKTNDQTDSLKIGDAYDPRPQEDNARRTIAYLLIALLFIVVSAIFILCSFGTIKVSEIKEFAVILGPIVTLVSAATGFYYGTKSNGT
ncbi:hypothetical protein ABHN84_20720 [Shewanella vesiculosa]|uniref:Uncharacterized protein n=1 Tax=Shewanella vesiculosa TaxID=518738 RepID=A0ABV0FXM8_9GAMM